MTRVVLRYTDPGDAPEIYADDGVEVLVVCEYTPSDRIYRTAPQPVPAGMLDGPVGHLHDGSAAEARVVDALRAEAIDMGIVSIRRKVQ